MAAQQVGTHHLLTLLSPPPVAAQQVGTHHLLLACRGHSRHLLRRRRHGQPLHSGAVIEGSRLIQVLSEKAAASLRHRGQSRMTCGGQEFQPPARLLDVLSWGDSRGQDDSEMAMIRLCLDKTLSYHGDKTESYQDGHDKTHDKTLS